MRFFDHPNLQSPHDYKFFFFCFTSKILGIWGLVVYRWKGLENTFPMVYYTPQKFKLQPQAEKEKTCIVD
jgi:hypothetical protein